MDMIFSFSFSFSFPFVMMFIINWGLFYKLSMVLMLPIPTIFFSIRSLFLR